MMLIRPIRQSDLDQLTNLAEQTAFGLTTLPKDRKLLSKRIDDAVAGFSRMSSKPQGETYLFVLEDTKTGQVVGISGIVSKVGGFEPFYAYQITTSTHKSQTLNVSKQIKTLHLLQEHNGPCEIGSLFLSPQYRQRGAGRLLSISRFLFLAQYPNRFDPNVIAEMRGVITKQGTSPFWDAIGKHFFEIDFPTADYLSIVDKRFIADLMPRHPIYIPLLPKAAQQVIGKVHENTRPARHILETEGFSFNQVVDIFEAGPILQCQASKIRAVRDSVIRPIIDIVDRFEVASKFAIASFVPDFKVALGYLESIDQGIVLSSDVALALKVHVGDSVRYVKLNPMLESNSKQVLNGH